MAGKGKLIAMAMTATMVVGTAGTALAANPKLTVQSASVNSTGSLVISARGTGLGNNQNVTIYVGGEYALASATWGCVNGSGKVPNAANKRTSSFEPTVSQEVTADRNGSVRATITINPPAAPSSTDLKCGGGQRLALLSVAYSGLEVTWSVDGTSVSVPFASQVFYS